MAELEIIQIPLLRDNYGYVLIDHDTGTTGVVDPSEAAPVLDLLNSRNLPLHYILNTHHHPDHTGGNLELKKQTNCKIICSYTEKPRVPGADEVVEEGDEFHLGNTKIKIMEVPGHTLGAIVFYIPANRAAFTGDTLFSLGCGRVFEGTHEQMWNSIRRIGNLPRATRMYCGHEYTQANGEFALSVDPHNQVLKDYCHHVADLRKDGLPSVPSTMEIEIEANPFLRAPQLREALGLDRTCLPYEIFTEMRKRKDHF